MIRKKAHQLLSLALSLVMVLTLLPAAVMAAPAKGSGDAEYQKILHLDCGRKYFTQDWIVALINEMAEDGYTHLQLAFGNDGLRFLLDDMSVDTYSSEAVTDAVQTGNRSYADAGVNELTETEMDAILAHAASKGIQVIPLLNSPGHMNAIVTAMGELGIRNANEPGSRNTMNLLGNEKAVSFTTSLVEKYVDYFAAKGCTQFNIGADEYANDAGGAFSFNRLYGSDWTKFVSYVNGLASYIKGQGMTPIAFNDGFYFNGRNDAFDTSIVIQYWSNGWGSYPLASPQTIAKHGHSMVNFHGDFYYVLGKDDKFDNDYHYAANFQNTQFASGNGYIAAPAGSAFAIWCDYPFAESEQEVARKVRLPMRAMALSMNDQQGTVSNMDTGVVSSGFNADGSINAETLPPVPPAEVELKDSATSITVKAPGLTSLEVQPAEAVAVEGASDVRAWNVTPASAEGRYTGSAQISLPIPAAWDGKEIKAFVQEAGGVTLIDGVRQGNFFTFTCPHFSTVGLAAYDAGTTAEKQVNLFIGQEQKDTQTNLPAPITGDYSNDVVQVILGDAQDTSVGGGDMTRGGQFKNITSMQNGQTKRLVLASGSNMLTGNGQNAPLPEKGQPLTPENVWTLECVNAEAQTFRISRDGKYLGVDSQGGLSFDASRDSVWTYDGTFYQSQGWDTYYLRYSSYFGWSTSSWSGSSITLYQVKEASLPGAASYTQDITFRGLTAGSADLTIGSTTYHVTVSYRTKDLSMVLHQTDTQTQSQTIQGAPQYSVPGIVQAEVSGNRVTFTALSVGDTVVTVGDTRYTIHVSDRPAIPDDVSPLTVEYWITNRRITAGGSNSQQLDKTSNAALFTEEGIAAAELNPVSGTDTSGNKVNYWRTRCLPNGQNQTDEDGVDQTKAGTAVERLRYWNDEWSYFDGSQWTAVNNSDQIVAYYLQETKVTREVTTNVVDWGETYESWQSASSGHWFWGKYVENGKSFVYVDFAVVYPDGTQNPGRFPVPNTLFFHCDGGTRDIGAISFTESGNYEIVKVTVTNGSASGYRNYGSFKPNYDDRTEQDVWVKGESQGSPHLDGLTNIPNQKGRLIRVYVQPKINKGALEVHYMDGQPGDATEFHKIGIVTKTEDVTFDSSFGMNEGYTDINQALHNNAVENDLGVTQYVNANLKPLTTIAPTYRFSSYTLTHAERSADGKDVYLYYTFDNAHHYVIDFGLPFQIKPGDWNITGGTDASSAEIMQGKYGTITYDTDNALTYTPTKVLKKTDTVALQLTIGAETVTHYIYIHPASNVLYEEGFLKAESVSSQYVDWRGGSRGTGFQDSANEGPYGYQNGYVNNTVRSVSGLSTGATTENLTTTFQGNAFDLIGTSGPDTGMVFLSLKATDGSNVRKAVVIDTSHSSKTLTEVPLAHVTVPDGTYSVTLFGGYRTPPAAAASNAPATYARMSRPASLAPRTFETAVADFLAREGIQTVEYVNLETGITQTLSALRMPAARTFAAPAAAPAAAGNGPAVSQQAGTRVEIDGFRVYLDGNQSAYVADEKNVTYANVLDVINDHSFAAYVDGTGDRFTVTDYEPAGGPQNEVYLSHGQAVALKATPGAQLQVSLRNAESAASALINGSRSQAVSGTEMYYQVTASPDGLVTIQNNGSGLLGIGNVKYQPSAVSLLTLEERDHPMVFSLLSAAPPVQEGFVPETFQTDLSVSKRLRKTVASLTVTASTDVSYLTVNGHREKPDNARQVKRGSAENYEFRIRESFRRGAPIQFEIVAYDAAGQPSQVYTVTE